MLNLNSVLFADCDARSRVYSEFLGICSRVLHGHDTASMARRQPFHGTGHSLVDVCNGARAVFKRILPMWTSMEDAFAWPLVHMAAAGHDWYQSYEIGKSPFHSRIVRLRERGPNEQKTALDARALLVALAEQHGATFSDLELEALYEGIVNTFPEWDGDGFGTIIQPQLHELLAQLKSDGVKGLHPAMFAFPMGDLAAAGIDVHAGLRAGDAEFREVEVQIGDRIMEAFRANSCDVIPAAEQAEYLAAMKAWDYSQKSFFANRKAVTEFELSFFPAEIREALEGRFNQYDATIHWSKVRTHQRMEYKSMWSYAQSMGYAVPIAA